MRKLTTFVVDELSVIIHISVFEIKYIHKTSVRLQSAI